LISVAVLGAGHWGPHLIRNFDNRQRSNVAWVIDRDEGRLEEVRSRFPDVKVADDAAVALADDSVDAVIVATPTTTHYALAKEAIGRGKHVMVEKPIATSSREAQELTDLAAAAGRVLMVGHVFVYNSAVQRVKQYIDTGDLGRVYYISMVRTNLGPIRTDVNAAWDLAAHDLSIADLWLGAHAQAASAVGGGWINPGLDDVVFATLRYPNEVLVNLHVSWLNPRKARDITVVGDNKMLTFDDMNLGEPIRIYDKGVAAQRVGPLFTDTFSSFRASIREGDVTIPKVPVGEPLMSECMHFLDCVERGTAPLTGGPEGTAVVRTLEALERSMRDGGRETPVA
jgi:predicted dehydrogenase